MSIDSEKKNLNLIRPEDIELELKNRFEEKHRNQMNKLGSFSDVELKQWLESLKKLS